MLKGIANRGLGLLDGLAASVSPGLVPEPGSLLTVLFHSLFQDKAEAESGALDPQQRITVGDFRVFIERFLEAGYAFVSPDDIEAGLPAGRKCMMVTFDDGYFNNSLAAGVLEEFRVPATFYISTNHVLAGKGFWWDVAYRGAVKAGLSPSARRAKIASFKSAKHDAIEAALTAAYGPKAFVPAGDTDRPFTPAELKEFAGKPFVHIGNHTCDHAILTNYPREEMAAQIRGCQQALAAMLGRAPSSIAYPNGNFSEAVMEAARAEGLKIGITLVPRRNTLPLESGKARLALGRFILWGDRDIAAQCRVFRSPLAPSHLVKGFFKRGY
jgi:peptidoglycan/xylan/chitin deacetylase (PgdA/CDA1 family)